MSRRTAIATRTIPRKPAHTAAALLAFAGSLAAMQAAHAAAVVECVASVYGNGTAADVGLIPAFFNATTGTEGTDWEIRVQAKGSQNPYVISNNLSFAPDASHDNKSIKVTGGWNAGCGSQTFNSSQTVIKGIASTSQSVGTSILFSGDNARFEIDWIHFQDFARFSVDDKACKDFQICPDTDAIVVEHNEFDNGEQVAIHAHDAAQVRFRGNRVTHISNRHASGFLTDSAPVSFLIDNDEDAPQIAFNTFADLTCNESLGGVMIDSHQGSASLNHNIAEADCAGLYIETTGGGKVLTPTYNVVSGIAGTGVGGDFNANHNLIATVNFEDPANGNYRLHYPSTGINEGATLVGAIQAGYLLPGLDLDGKFRPIGVHFDIGAYENDKNDGTPPTFTVTKIADSDDGMCNADCSLREAIKAALAFNGTNPAEIVFDLPGCPSVLVLDSNLPDITSSVTIDGYSQAGANANSQITGSNANICVGVTPGASGVDYAFRVPSGADPSTQLTVQGLGFGNGFFAFGSSHAVIELRGGSQHKIYGNAFGGYLPSTTNPQFLGTLGRAILLNGPANYVHIGDDDASTRNYFGYMDQNGIVLNNGTQSNFIVNNYIGVEPSGLFAQPNSGDGISISSALGTVIRKNVIAASDSGITLLGANTKNTQIYANRIGLDAALKAAPSLSNNVGITIGLGASNTAIGSGIDATANVISNNKTDGVQIGSTPDSTPGGPVVSSGNTILGNRIDANARSGTGVNIDLGASLVRVANDDGDGDTGANGLQNYPILNRTAVNANVNNAPFRFVDGIINTQPNVQVSLDVFFSTTCTAGSYDAEASKLVKSYQVSSGSSGTVSFLIDMIPDYGPGFITATATNYAGGGTSDLSPCLPTDRIFSGGFQKPGL